MKIRTIVLSCILAIGMCFIGVLNVCCQESYTVDSSEVNTSKDHHFRFIYIDHEPDTPVGELCKRIEKIHNDALETGDKLIIYLSNEDAPFVSLTNIGNEGDGLDIFYEIIDELQNRTYHVVSSADVDSIKSLIGIDGYYPLFNESGEECEEFMRYASVSLDFYIGSRFWALRYNEKILASLYVYLEMPKYMQKCPLTNLSFNVYRPLNVKLIHPEEKPFGESNLGNINQQISIKEY